jgi:hypothetical protein
MLAHKWSRQDTQSDADATCNSCNKDIYISHLSTCPVCAWTDHRLQAATEVGQPVLRGKNVRESVKTRGGDVVKDFAEQGAKALLQQAGRGSKRRPGQRSNLSTTKRLKLCSHLSVPRHIKWR